MGDTADPGLLGVPLGLFEPLNGVCIFTTFFPVCLHGIMFHSNVSYHSIQKNTKNVNYHA